MVRIKKVHAFWTITLEYECPYCDEYKEYIGSDDCAEGGCESLPEMLAGGTLQMVCDGCDKELILDIKEGNS